MLEKIGLLCVGWLLGLLGPLLVDHVRRERDNELGRKAILSELHEVGGILASVVHTVQSKDGTIDRKHLEWLKAYIEKGERTDPFPKWIEKLEAFLSWTDDEIAANFEIMKTREGKGLMLQKYPVPLLDSRVSALWSFETEFQRDLLAIRQGMHRLDDMVDRQRKLHDMTFSKMDPENREALEANIKETVTFYGQSAQKVVDKIANLTS